MTSFCLFSCSSLMQEGAKGEIMEGSEVLGKDMVEQDEAEKGEKSEERRFKVGELVEFWEESFVRGYTTEGGEPA